MKSLSLLLTATLMFSSGAFAAELGLQKSHLKQGIKCASCHGKEVKAAIRNPSCLNCHESFTKLGQRTADMALNPHLSPHFKDLECTACHSDHDTLNNFCQDCHGPITRKN